MSRSLEGRVILVTRAREQAAALAALLEERGATVIEAPAIRIEDPPDWKPVDEALSGLASYDWIVFTSQNTLPRLLDRMDEIGVDPSALRRPALAAIGEATTAVLVSHGLRARVVAEEYRAEGLVEALAGEPLEGKRILIPRALVARDVLPERLRERGAVVDVAPLYRVAPDVEGAEATRRAFTEGAVEAVTFTSPSTVEGVVAGLRAAADVGLVERLRGVCLASIGPITSEALRAHGLAPTVEASPYTAPALAQALADYFQSRPRNSREAR